MGYSLHERRMIHLISQATSEYTMLPPPPKKKLKDKQNTIILKAFVDFPPGDPSSLFTSD